MIHNRALLLPKTYHRVAVWIHDGLVVKSTSEGCQFVPVRLFQGSAVDDAPSHHLCDRRTIHQQSSPERSYFFAQQTFPYSPRIQPRSCTRGFITRFHSTKTTATPSTIRSLIDDKNLHPSTDSGDIVNIDDPETLAKLEELIQYRGTHGDVHFPCSNTAFGIAERKKLGVSQELATWVTEQRTTYRRFNKNKSTKQIKQKTSLPNINVAFPTLVLVLESLGFMWEDREAQWQRSFNLLEKHQQEKGTMHVLKEESPQLFTWLDNQRKSYSKNKLPESRVTLLKEIGFVFDVQDAKWWETFHALVEYQSIHGDTNVSKNNGKKDDKALGHWVIRQRQLYQSNELNPERAQALKELGFSWDVHADKWEAYYQQMSEYYQQHGHTQVPKSENPGLYYWADRQRRKLRIIIDQKKHQLPDSAPHQQEVQLRALDKLDIEWSDETVHADRIERLKQLHMKVDVYIETWMSRYETLCDFYGSCGHFSVSLAANPELFNWVKYQRILFNQGTLDSERVEMLDKIGFPWSGSSVQEDRMFAQLQVFFEKHGHIRVPSKQAGLRRWIKQQRTRLLSGGDTTTDGGVTTLSEDRRQALETMFKGDSGE